ncbi:tetratricopeptide repeat protein [Kitasatospora purpeofusca]|uniref:tetratricopeptide repeat protein n=1 Tax=Kitasatospora purpeofusca TaxID=67352 RepID=UPI00340CF04C
MSCQEVFIVAARDESEHAELVAGKLREAGYPVSHSGTVPVGDSVVEAALQALDRNAPVVLCATLRAVGSEWTHKLVGAARARASSRVFVIQMEAEAYLDQLAVGTVTARYCDDPVKAMSDLLAALQRHFPCPPPPAPPPTDQAADRAGHRAAAGQFLDEPGHTAEFDHDVVRAFRADLHEDVLADHPATLTAAEFLKRTGVWSGEELTHTGVLMFTRYPVPGSVRSMVKCVEYFGPDRSAPRHPVTFEGPVTELIAGARDFVAKRVHRGELPSSENARSAPVHELPMIAVREIIANALVHRDYARADACVHVRLFTDRLEVSSPGTWPGGVLADADPRELTALEGQSVKRNFQLARLLTWNRLVEGEGSGIPTAVADCDSVGAAPPRVVESDGFVTVTLLRRAQPRVFPAMHAVRPSWPLQVGPVPRLPDHPVIRIEGMWLHDAAHGGATVVTGMGGVGKTYLAALHATQALSQGQLDLLVWVSATSRESVLTGYAQAAASLHLATADDVPTAARLFLNHLATADFRWLVVLDDVVEPSAVSDLWPPRHSAGSVVVTTRRRDSMLIDVGRRLHLDTFTREESVVYLSGKLADAGMQDEPGPLAELAESLGFLPLALAQAATYMVDVHLNSSDYLRLLTDRELRLQDILPDSSGLPDAQRTTLSATWALSVAQADRMRPLGMARPVLELASMLSPSGIPLDVFLSEAALGYLSARASQEEADAGRSPREARAALSCLHRLGLVSFEHDRGLVRVHRLLQRLTLEHLPPAGLDGVARAAADALAEVWDTDGHDSARAQDWRNCAQALLGHTPHVLWDSGAHPVMLRLAESIGTTMPLEAVRYLDQLATEATERLGPDHPDVLETRSFLAGHLAAAGDLVRAAAELKRLVADTLRVLGPHHRDSLRAAHDLAWCRGQSGHPAEAVEALTTLLDEAQKTFGADHPDAVSIRRSLATWRGECGDTTGAIAELRELLASAERLFGPDHPETLLLRGRLAWSVGRSGDAPAATRLWRALVSDQTRVLGAEHPDALTSGNNLAALLGQAGDFRGAAELQERILETQRRVLGADHPNTLTSGNNLASWLGQRGDALEAVGLLTHIAVDQARVFGPNHPETVVTRANLAHWLGTVLESSTLPAEEIAAPVRRLDARLAAWVTACLREPDRTVKPWQELVDRALASDAQDLFHDLVRASRTPVEQQGVMADSGSVAIHIAGHGTGFGGIQGNVGIIRSPGTDIAGNR